MLFVEVEIFLDSRYDRELVDENMKGPVPTANTPSTQLSAAPSTVASTTTRVSQQSRISIHRDPEAGKVGGNVNDN